MRVTLAAAALCPMLVGEVSSKYCDGGHYCSPPKECCTLDCCYTPFSPPGYHPPAVPPPAHVFNIVMWNHWFLVLFAVLSCVGCCSLWRRWRPGGRRCWRADRDRAAGEDDDEDDEDEDDEASSGRRSSHSCCPPPPHAPHYSRCRAPPPYAEVTAKPDLYPLVISYGDSGKPPAAGSYLMVQYFRNYIVRPVGSLSATSTADSLSSSFLCSATNEANCVVPPPYSSSLDGLTEPSESLPVPAPPPPPQSFVSATALSTTGSDVSSLAGGGSPPQATSPTQEIREILDKIQQLPLSPKRRAPAAAAGHRHWLPRSAPTTPSGVAPPGPLLPPAPRPSSGGNRRWHGSAGGTEDGSPLLGEPGSGDDQDGSDQV
ncbi:uncharacterized protein LOC134536768 isoform X2 [Bacillus rossius redtenbacheri]|uniref:uncharacterized protein LOC134536768 isoform X2 n=1 Tax=Bacillus rossius redtenbacheri TaxID=93214 RepID=UPI002FDC8D27